MGKRLLAGLQGGLPCPGKQKVCVCVGGDKDTLIGVRGGGRVGKEQHRLGTVVSGWTFPALGLCYEHMQVFARSV